MPSPPESGPPEERRRPSAPPPGSAEDALRRLEQRLDRATEAAERLMAEAAGKAAGAGNPAHREPANNPEDVGEPATPPPAGWQIPDDARAGVTSELDPFVALVQAMRDLIPPELQRRLVAALRELLLALRALIDWYLERLERRREESVEVEDIPIV
jgi:hypothetical protein